MDGTSAEAEAGGIATTDVEAVRGKAVAAFIVIAAMTSIGTLAMSVGAAGMMFRWVTVETIGALVPGSGSGAVGFGAGRIRTSGAK